MAFAMPDCMPVSFAPTAAGSKTTMEHPRRRSTSSAKKATKRLSQQLSGSLPILPYTTAEWAKAVADIKREYLNRRYKPCAARCSDILDSIRQPSTFEPAYLIYLHFYAASAMEMLARSLHHSSRSRIALLEQARQHYLQASQLIKVADAAVSQSSLQQRRPPSCPPLQHSPTSSISSVASSRISPTSSISSFQDATKTTSRRSKCSARNEDPIVRPDSPTLGFDDWPSRPSSELISAMPLPPLAAPPSQSIMPSAITRIEEEAEDEFNCDPFLRERSIHRYRTILSGLERQVSRHLVFIDDDLASSQATPTPSNDELRALELQARIERLRAKGWQRKRFDAKRYETLCETALADMMES